MLFRSIVLLIVFCVGAFSNIADEKVVICGLVKNVGKKLPHTIKSIERFSSLFKDFRIVIYENNSHDESKSILKQWQSHQEKLYLISKDLSEDELRSYCVAREENNRPCRIELLSAFRNKLLNEINKSEYDGFNYVIMLDMDLYFPEIFYRALKDTFNQKNKWDAVFANSSLPNSNYIFDWYAYRSAQVPIGPEFDPDWWMNRDCRVDFTKNKELVPVYSAFGGMGIYKKKAFKGLKYTAFVSPLVEDFTKNLLKDPNIKNTYFAKRYFINSRRWARSKMIYNISDFIENPFHENFEGIIPKYRAFYISNGPDSLCFFGEEVNSFFPIMCEHVTLHYQMIQNGYNRLFIHPQLRLVY